MNEIKKATTNDKKADIILLSSIKKETCGKNYDSHLNDSDNDASLSEQNFNDSASSTGSGCEQQNIKHDGDEDPHKEKDEKVLGNGREARNKAEKNRRDKLNGSIQELSGMVPHVAESQRRVDKTAVLRYAAHGLRINHVFGNADENNAQLKSETIDSLLKLLDSVLITISIRGQIILVTSNVEQHLGHCQTDLYGQNILNFIHPEDHTLVKTQLVPTNIETLFDLNSDIDAEESRPRTQEEEDLIDTKLQDDKRNFTVRFARAGPRSEPTSYEIVQINGYFRRADFAPRGAKSNTLPSGLQLIRRTRGRDDGIPLHTISGNDIALVCFAKVIKPPSMCDRLLEACKYEYKTRHLIDGRIVQCDQRISVVAGYMTEEVSGLSPFTFMHKDDVRWVIVALRQMYDNSKPYGESCYRLMTRTGQFIYLRTRGFLEIDDESNKVHSFYCINTLVTEDDGKKLVREMKKKFSVIINQIEIGETEEMPSVENPQQIEKAVLNLITNLNNLTSGEEASNYRDADDDDKKSIGGATIKELYDDDDNKSTKSSMHDDYCSDVEKQPKSPPLAIIAPKPSTVKSSITKSVSVIVAASKDSSYAKQINNNNNISSNSNNNNILNLDNNINRPSVLQTHTKISSSKCNTSNLDIPMNNILVDRSIDSCNETITKIEPNTSDFYEFNDTTTLDTINTMQPLSNIQPIQIKQEYYNDASPSSIDSYSPYYDPPSMPMPLTSPHNYQHNSLHGSVINTPNNPDGLIMTTKTENNFYQQQPQRKQQTNSIPSLKRSSYMQDDYGGREMSTKRRCDDSPVYSCYDDKYENCNTDLNQVIALSLEATDRSLVTINDAAAELRNQYAVYCPSPHLNQQLNDIFVEHQEQREILQSTQNDFNAKRHQQQQQTCSNRTFSQSEMQSQSSLLTFDSIVSTITDTDNSSSNSTSSTAATITAAVPR